MAGNKTIETGSSVAAFIEAIADTGQREDARVLAAMMARLSGEPARMWGPSIIGYGSYHYRYESGREGEMCRIGFSPRAGKFAIYGLDIIGVNAGALAQLGKHATGKGCLYLKRLADVDLVVLEEMIARSLSKPL
jgi:hypothetical protein